MGSGRTMLSDKLWARIELCIKDLIGTKCRRKTNNRLFFEAILWLARTGSPWRDLPAHFGLWNSIYQRFRRWAKAGIPSKKTRKVQRPFDAATYKTRNFIERFIG